MDGGSLLAANDEHSTVREEPGQRLDAGETVHGGRGLSGVDCAGDWSRLALTTSGGRAQETAIQLQ